MRKLASIVKVGDILPIEGADRIELATIVDKAWQCVVLKGEVNKGDLAVYFEIDSFLPIHNEFTTRLKACKTKKMHGAQGLHLKTIRFRGQLSQGLLLPCELFQADLGNTVELNDNVTELLGVKLFEMPIPACLCEGSNVVGAFPNFLRKSDQARIQNKVHYFEKFKSLEFEVTVKMDGTSFTAYHNNELPNVFGVCTRNLEIQESEKNTYWKVANRLEIPKRLAKFHEVCGRNIMIQAELCGEGIQKNRDKIRGQNIFVYDIFDIDEQRYAPSKERMDILEQLNSFVKDVEKIRHVPLVGHMNVFEEYPTFDELQTLADGESYCKKNRREGVVCKSVSASEQGNVVSFKVISNRYLLKHGE